MRTRIVALVIILSLFAVACGDGDPPSNPSTPTLSPDPTALPLPTSTMLPTPTASPLLVDAGDIALGETMVGAVSANGGARWAFTAVAEEMLTLVVEPRDGALDVVVDVWGSDQRSILPDGAVDASFGRESVSFEIPTDGAYTITIVGLDGSRGDYTLTLAPFGQAVADPTAESGTEHTPGEGVIAYGETVAGTLASAGTARWQFTAAQGDVIDIIVTTPAEEQDIVLDLLDSAGQSVFENGPIDNSFSGERLYIFFVPISATYTIQITDLNSTPGVYEVALLAANGGGAGSLLLTSDTLDPEDRHAFPFTALEGDVVRAVLEPTAEQDVVLSIYNNESRELLEEMDRSLGIEELIYTVPSDGAYYFEVRGFTAEDSGGYDILLTGTPLTRFDLALGDSLLGTFQARVPLEHRIVLEAGEEVMLDAFPLDEALDLRLAILDNEGTLLLVADEAGAGEIVTLSYTATTAGALTIRFSEASGLVGKFGVDIR